jgi:hypothetical protein
VVLCGVALCALQVGIDDSLSSIRTQPRGSHRPAQTVLFTRSRRHTPIHSSPLSARSHGSHTGIQCALFSRKALYYVRAAGTQRGLRRLVERGLMTEREHFALTSSGVPHTARHNGVRRGAHAASHTPHRTCRIAHTAAHSARSHTRQRTRPIAQIPSHAPICSSPIGHAAVTPFDHAVSARPLSLVAVPQLSSAGSSRAPSMHARARRSSLVRAQNRSSSTTSCCHPRLNPQWDPTLTSHGTPACATPMART